MEKDSLEKKFEDWLYKLKREVGDAYMHFKIFKFLSEQEGEELNFARCFFTMTIYAHLEATLVHILKVIDRNSDLNIWKFLEFVKENLNLFSAERVAERIGNRFDKTS